MRLFGRGIDSVVRAPVVMLYLVLVPKQREGSGLMTLSIRTTVIVAR
jgi:hypothetical protein